MAHDANNMLSCVLWAWLMIAIIAAIVTMYKRRTDSSNKGVYQINSWAQSNDFEIRVVEHKAYANRGYAGPFIGLHLGEVFRVVVTKIGDEKRRVAWISVGGDFKVIWEDEWRPPEPPVG